LARENPSPFGSDSIEIQNLASSVYEMANNGSSGTKLFEIRGVDVEDLANALIFELGIAVDNNDFTDILSPQRDFIVYV
jgi:hypothetical protein